VGRGRLQVSNMTTIPSQDRVTIQILEQWHPFQDLKLTLTVSRRPEQLRLRTPQRIVATVEDSVLRTEMGDLESQEEDVPKRILWFKSMSSLNLLDMRIGPTSFASHPRTSIRKRYRTPSDKNLVLSTGG
jgi:hypothetical protein